MLRVAVRIRLCGRLKKSEELGFALHLRAHHLLHDSFDRPGLGLDFWTFHALLVTQNLRLGRRTLSSQLETVEGLGAFFADLHEMVAAYQTAVPAVRNWYRQIMAQHRAYTGGF